MMQENGTVVRVVKAGRALALVVAALALAGCGPQASEIDRAVGEAMKAGLAADFGRLEFEAPAYDRKLEPALVFKGQQSTILAITEPSPHGSFRRTKTLTQSALARTKSGRYFEFTYVSASIDVEDLVDEPCVAAKCRYIRDGRPLSETEAKNWFFHSPTFSATRYKALFNEEAPPQRVEA